jgi:hypothetical protein
MPLKRLITANKGNGCGSWAPSPTVNMAVENCARKIEHSLN